MDKLKPAHVTIKQAADLLGMNPEVVRRHVKKLGIPVVANPNDRRSRNIDVMRLIDIASQERRGDGRPAKITLTWQDGPQAGKTVEIELPKATRKTRTAGRTPTTEQITTHTTEK